MKLKATAGAYSSVVGNSVNLFAPSGEAVGMLTLINGSRALTKEQYQAVITQAAALLDGKIELPGKDENERVS